MYLEEGTRRVFAGAIDWPGWCRSARDEEGAILALVEYAPRYAAALRRAARGFTPPEDQAAFRVVERLEGNASTDFGAPGIVPSSDERPVSQEELRRLTALLKVCWRAFDRATESASSKTLRKGPRGGGRDLDAIVSHVLEAEAAYTARLGGKHCRPGSPGAAEEMAAVRRAFLDAMGARARGDPLPEGPRSRTVWPPRYGVRRSAWHALDHAWEIEDRATD